MKQFLVLLLLALNACAAGDDEGSECAGHIGLGAWTNGATDTMTLKKSCMATSSYCQSTFQFSQVYGSYIAIEVIYTNGRSGCLARGTHTCEFSIYNPANQSLPDVLTIDCGNGNSVYTQL